MPEYTTAPFTFVKHVVFYFTRRIPKDLNHHYIASKISFSLRTRSPLVAKSRAQRAAQQLDEHWYHLRIHDVALPGKHLLRMGAAGQAGSAIPLFVKGPEDTLKLSEAVSIYLKLKGKDRPITFHRAAERSCGYVIDACGDRDICSYTKRDANGFRDALLERALTGSSITRIFGTVRSVINFAASEIGITLHNPFAGVYYDRTAGVEGREPLPLDAIREVQANCHEIDDDLRWLVALISDTGMRLAEAAGLRLDDLVIAGPTPHGVVREHPWRRLKTPSSARSVPLVGASLWAAQRILEAPEGEQFAFPRYNRAGDTNANSASAALNKCITTYAPKPLHYAQLQAFDARQASGRGVSCRHRRPDRRLADRRVSIRRGPSDRGYDPMVSPSLCPTSSTALRSKFCPLPMAIAAGIGPMMINCASWRRAS